MANENVYEIISTEISTLSLFSKINLYFTCHLDSIEVLLDSNPANYEYKEIGQTSQISFIIEDIGNHLLRIEFKAPTLTKIDENKFVFSPTFNFVSEVKNFKAKIVLSENLAVVAPMVPPPTKMYTMENSFIIEWEKSNVIGGFYILVGIKKCGGESISPVYLVAFIPMFFLGFILGLKIKKQNKRPNFTTDEKILWNLIGDGGKRSYKKR
ncbi:MAG: hypothetical protein ACXQTP_00735 [Candidatus Methanofastidiosia archaeon]